MPDVDYQWPSGKLRVPVSHRRSTVGETRRLQAEVEAGFSERFGYETLLLPSGRAGISLALRVRNIGRAHQVFAPKWSSYCVWNIIGRYSNPTIDLTPDVDVVLAVHKYARVERSREVPMPATVIEDSCDSLICDRSALFPNNGQCEIVSLPKIMGTYGGGLLICREPGFAAEARRIAADSTRWSEPQGRKRWQITRKSAAQYNAWEANEFQNFLPDYGLVRHIQQNLAALQENAETITARLARLVKRHAHFFPSLKTETFSKRLPPVLVADGASPNHELMRRHVNLVQTFDRTRFANVVLVPVHFGVTDDQFESIIKQLRPIAPASVRVRRRAK